MTNMQKSVFDHFDSVVIIDTETTGLDYRTDEIIELAAMQVTCSGGTYRVEGELDLLIHLSEGKKLPHRITELTGISMKMLCEGGVSKAEAAQQFSAMLDNSRPLLVAYNAQFDLCFLYSFLNRHGSIDILKQSKMLDAMTVYKDRHEYPHKLSDAVITYNLNAQNTHRALDDARATLELLLAMEKERGDLDRYINLFGYNPRYGVSGKKISSVRYMPQGYSPKQKLYEK